MIQIPQGTVVASGDTVLMNDGDYGMVWGGRTTRIDVNAGFTQATISQPTSRFTSWVTFKAAPGQEPHASVIDLGTLNLDFTGTSPVGEIGPDVQGNGDLYMRFEGITVDDGVIIKGSRHVAIVDCAIHREGELSGSKTNLESKAGVDLYNVLDALIQGNDITHVAVGVTLYGAFSTRIQGNNIHHNSHDGIWLNNGDQIVIDQNRIHDLDCGADAEDDTLDPAYDPALGWTWYKHVDGIQSSDGGVTNLTVSRNYFYHIVDQDLMIGSSSASGNWVIENNIFGPVGGNVIHMGADIKGLIFRYNTVLHATNDAWQSIYPTNLVTGADRVLLPTVFASQFWASLDTSFYSGYLFYNNIFGDNQIISPTYGFVANNLYRGTVWGTLSSGEAFMADDDLAYEDIPGNINDYIATGKVPGTPKAGGAAHDTGTTRYASEVTVDIVGNPRGAKPDIGAVELQ